eukprot:3038962-Rhodomonas_salina.1
MAAQSGLWCGLSRGGSDAGRGVERAAGVGHSRGQLAGGWVAALGGSGCEPDLQQLLPGECRPAPGVSSWQHWSEIWRLPAPRLSRWQPLSEM